MITGGYLRWPTLTTEDITNTMKLRFRSISGVCSVQVPLDNNNRCIHARWQVALMQPDVIGKSSRF